MLNNTRRLHTLWLSVCLALAVADSGSAVYPQTPILGTQKHPIIDSRMTEAEAFDGLDPKCPDEIRQRQRLVTRHGVVVAVHRHELPERLGEVVHRLLKPGIVERRAEQIF